MLISPRSLVFGLCSLKKHEVVSRKMMLLSTQAHSLNCNHAIVKSDEGCSFQELVQKPVQTIQGIGPVHEEQLASLRIKTVQDLASYKYIKLARAIQTLAATEEPEKRSSEAVMNLNKGLDKAYETQSLNDILKAPVDALQGISEEAGKTWQHLGVKTVEDLANWKFGKWAEALEAASKFEE